MNLLGKWKVEKVFTDFDLDLKPQYTTKEEALKLEMYQDAESIKFINSIYDLKENGIDVIYNGEVVQTVEAQIIDGAYYITEGGLENKFEMAVGEDGLISFMTILKLKKM